MVNAIERYYKRREIGRLLGSNLIDDRMTEEIIGKYIEADPHYITALREAIDMLAQKEHQKSLPTQQF